MDSSIFSQMQGGLIVSCQALPDEPLYGSQMMAAMARAAVLGGAVGIRANTPEDVSAIRAVVSVPLIGLYKHVLPGYEQVYITPTVHHAIRVAQAGADLIAVDATLRPHPEGLDLPHFIFAVRQTTGLPLLADISTFEEGVAAVQAGADAVSTTLSGYTPYSRQDEGPDLELVARLAAELTVPVIAEGRIITPEQARAALDAGAYAVVVGGAITRPQLITRRFSAALGGAA